MRLTITVAVVIFVVTASAGPLLNVTFERSSGKYTEAMAYKDFVPGSITYIQGLKEGRGTIVSNNDGRYLRVTYPSSCLGPSTCGVQIKLDMGVSADELWTSYRMRFVTGFDPVRGGKLPGLCGGTCVTGGDPATGENSWSARVMWRNGGKAEQYVYAPGEQGANGYGGSLFYKLNGTQVAFAVGRWYTLTTRVIMNHGGAANGTVESYVDGVLVLQNNGMLWRTADSAFGINIWYLSTFYGGSDASWSPNITTYIDFDDILVSSAPLV